MKFFRMFTHLLPNARAWRLMVDKQLRQFFEGLAPTGSDAVSFFDGVWLDLFPETTRELDAWESQFGLRDTGLTEQERRDRLAAAWSATGGQDPRYIQDTLQANGFDVYVHEWWVPGTEPPVGGKYKKVTLYMEAGESIAQCGEAAASCGDSAIVTTSERWCSTPRNPLEWLRQVTGDTVYIVTCGNLDATCGNLDATCGATDSPAGYALVNKIYSSVPDYPNTCGNLDTTCGNLDATCGYFTGFRDVLKEYTVPSDATKWPYFLYIGGETFGTLAQVDPARRDEFEDLCLKICPTQQWLGILVEYT